MGLLVILVLCITAESLWERRYTWRARWEVAATLNVVLQGVELILMGGPVERYLAPRMHDAFGLWNVEELIGHLGYMLGMTLMAYTLLSRLNMSDSQLSRFARTRLALPALGFVPVVVLLFIVGGMGRFDAADLVLAHPTPWSRMYFMMYVAGDSYLLYIAAQALLIIRRDESQRRVANFYMFGVFVSALGCAVIAVGEWPILSWVVVRMETASYAVAAAYSWRMRVKHLRGSRPCNR